MTEVERKEYARAYYLANREKILARSRAWRDENRDYDNARRRAYDRARPEEVKVKRAARYLRDREQILAKERERNARNPEANRARVKKWRAEVSAEKWAAHAARREERTRERRAEQPEKYLIERARRTLVLTTGIAANRLSADVVQAKAAQLAVFDAIKNKGFCRQGHPLTADNIRIRPSTGWRECRACANARNKRRALKAKEVA